MPLTPATWLDDFIVNLTTTGSQTNPRVTQLANGNILVVWDSTDNTGAGAEPGIDVIGQVFNPLGERVGGEVPLNFVGTLFDDRIPDVAALPDGGFVVAYQTVENGLFSVLMERFDAAGTLIESEVVAQDSTPNAAPSNFPPIIAVSSATSTLVVWEQSEVSGDSLIFGRVFNPATGDMGPQISLINIPGTNSAPSVTVLNNGTYVIACATVAIGGDQQVVYRMINPAGSNVLGVTRIASTVGDGFNDREAAVTALTGGGFVITWSNSASAILAQRFNSAGVAQGGVVTVAEGAAGTASEPDVVGLLDGGFLVIFDFDLLGEEGLRARRFDANGAQVGAEITIATGFAVDDPDAERLDDGRVAVTFRDAAGEIRMEILDTRDAANNPGVYGPPDWQIGTIGNDTITSDGDVFFVAGHDGDDTLITGGPAATYLGGNGNDLVLVNTLIDGDTHDGGSGIDRIDWSGSGQTGGIFDLAAGTATDASDPGNVLSEAMAGFENLIGTTGADSITGTGDGNDLDGGFGDDSLTGAGGNDSLDGDGGDDTILGGDFDDRLAGGTENDRLFGGNGFDTLFGDAGDDTLDGGLDDDSLFGGDGDDTVDGGFGNDTLFGGDSNDRFTLALAEGNDAFFGGDGTDTLDLSALTEFDLAINLAGGTWGDSSFVFGVAEDIENAVGSVGSDSITGSAADNSLDGRGGADALHGGAGNDTLTGGTGIDRLEGGAGQDSLFGGGDNDTLAGGGDSDTLFGGEGNDRFEATGDGQLNQNFGEGGDDTFALSNVHFFGHIFGGNGTGDHLDGSGSTDFALIINMAAQTYNDTATFDLQGIEHATGGQQADRITGNAGANWLDGQAGNDTLNGGLGRDILLGGAGNDAFVVNAAGDRVFETTTTASGIDAGGIDTVQSAVSFNLDASAGVRFVERLTLTGTAAINGTGNVLANILTGNAGRNVLNGGLGNDILLGGAGNDAFVVNAAGDRVFETTTTASGIDAGGIDTVQSAVSFNLDASAGVRFVERLTLTGTAATNGTGNALANILTGNAGRNVLNGGLGNDILLGGAGNDAFVVNAAGDRVFETTTTTSGIDAGGIDTVQSAVSFNLDASAGVRFVERLTLTGTAATNGTGNALANILTGNAGRNVLNGGLGNDILLGGAGNDAFVVNAAGDRVFETTTTASGIDAGGIDTVRSAVSFNLDASAGVRFVERLTLTGTADTNGTGNALANIVTGNAGRNVLNGGLGNDILLGGAGIDTFVFSTALGVGNIDRITDFNVVDDVFRLDDAVFAGLAGGRLKVDAFAANTTGEAATATDRIVYETDTGRLFFDSDGVGGAPRIQFATLNAGLALTNADFIVF